jgi:hypothetical protein
MHREALMAVPLVTKDRFQVAAVDRLPQSGQG